MARTYRCTIRCHDLDDGSLIEPSLHYQTDLATGGDEPDAGDVAEGVWLLIGGNFKALTHPRIQIDELVARSEEIPASGILPVQGVWPVATPGTATQTGTDMPRELVAIMNLSTATSVRSARGYMTLPGPYSGLAVQARHFAGNYKDVGDQLALQLKVSFSLGQFQPAEVHPVVYSRTRRVRGETPYTFRVTQAHFNTRPHWLRSRGTSP